MDTNGFGTDSERAALLKKYPGFLSRIAEQLGMSPAAVSRTFHGVTQDVNPRIAEAIRLAIAFKRQPKRKNEVK